MTNCCLSINGMICCFISRASCSYPSSCHTGSPKMNWQNKPLPTGSLKWSTKKDGAMEYYLVDTGFPKPIRYFQLYYGNQILYWVYDNNW